MTTLQLKLCSLASAVAMLALPSGASAAYLVPPGNSAATQYTESFPTAGGSADSSRQSGGSGRSHPVRVLGARNVRRLAAHGEQGRALAVVAAETAPPSLPRHHAAARGETVRRPGGQTGSSGSQGSSRGAAATRPRSDGSSGLGEVIGGTVGLSSGQRGPMLPIAIVATIVWLLAYLLRQRRTSTP